MIPMLKKVTPTLRNCQDEYNPKPSVGALKTVMNKSGVQWQNLANFFAKKISIF
jgi:hypothetical protein